MEITFSQTYAKVLQQAGLPSNYLPLHGQFPQTYDNQRQAALQTLRQLAQRGTPLRLWWTDTADDLCGFLLSCAELADAPSPLRQVHVPLRLPNWRGQASLLISGGLAAFSREDVSALLQFETPLSNAMAQAYSYEARDLPQTPLRVVINGQIVGMPADFYDCFLLDAPLATAAQRIATAIGYDLGIDETWYTQRIDALIAAHTLMPLPDGRLRKEV
ncbi:DUF3658 domain-containing protein [Lacticaseibacillus jixiensis]|uniref:DUF3658 domain-containing protein n=1 Tax=Lacticaseibacillus jixiensis TaxID=3231926 RepID=UPI0036F1F0C0